MMIKVARFVNLVLAGLLVGNEFGAGWRSIVLLSGVRTDNIPKGRFSATVGEEPEIELSLA